MKRKNIKLKLLLICFIVVFCFLGSCRSVRQETQKSTLTTQSYTEKKETYRDTVLFAPKAETSLKIPVSEFVFKPTLNGVSKPKEFTQKNGNATAKIKIEDNVVTVTATCDSLAIVAKIKQELQRDFNATARSDVGNKQDKTGYSVIYLIGVFLIGLIIGSIATLIIKTLKIA